jgi:tRNA-splicing ligase RtcB
VAATVLDILGAGEIERVHNHHNFVWREEVAGAPAWVVRKGCTPAFPGQLGFVGGSMGDDAVILEGIAGTEAETLLSSTIHGAGRVMSRKAAHREFTREQMAAWLQERGVRLRGGDLDESPMAYRRLPEVLARHAASIHVLHCLRPFAVVMAGPEVFDPFKD